ncbi:MAG: GntR family transcriptional regulator [Spirochaetes bacterium]|nr:GntR family transcriptional regulator [Spirochaetota bacterium]
MFKQVIYARIFEQLKKELATHPSPIPLTEAGLMKRFKISRNTSYKVLNLLESEGLVRRQRGRGTFPVETFAPRHTVNLVMRASSFENLALMRSVSSLLYLEGIAAAGARAFEARILMWPQEQDPHALREAVLGGGPRQGFVFFNHDDPAIEVCRREQVPYMARLPLGVEGINGVAIDSYRSVYGALDFMMKKSGRTKILMLCGDRTSVWQSPLARAYEAALLANGAKMDPQYLRHFSPDSGREKLELAAWLAEHPEIEGVFTVGFSITRALYDILLLRGVDFRSRWAWLAYNDPARLTSDLDFISCVREPLPKLGRLLAEGVLSMLETGYRPMAGMVLQNEFVVRESFGAPTEKTAKE